MSGLYHLDITLTGAAQSLAVTLDTAAYLTQRNKLPGIVQAHYGPVASQGGKNGGGYAVRMITLQADGGNSAAVKVGDSTIAAASWGWFIPAPTAAVPEPPLIIDGTNIQIHLDDIWLLGTANDVVHITVQPL